MKVILTEDVKSLGKKGEIVEVNDSYGRNVLLRQKKGVEATGKNLNDLKLQKANDQKVAEQNYAAAQELAAKLDEAQISLRVKVGEGGKLFGSVSSKEIAEAAASQLGLTIDKKKIQIPGPIKAVGLTQVQIKLHPKVTANLKVNIEEA